MLYKDSSVHHEEENALFFSEQKLWHRLSLVDPICVVDLSLFVWNALTGMAEKECTRATRQY